MLIGNMLSSLHGLLFPISSGAGGGGSFIYTISQSGYHTPQLLLHQSCNNGWTEN